MLPVNSLKIVFFGLIILGSVFEVVGDIFFKKWSIESKNILLGIGLLAYFVGSVFWAFSLKYEVLSKAISVFIIVNLLIAILVGVIFFKEDLSVLNKVGIVLGIIGIFLIEL